MDKNWFERFVSSGDRQIGPFPELDLPSEDIRQISLFARKDSDGFPLTDNYVMHYHKQLTVKKWSLSFVFTRNERLQVLESRLSASVV